MTEERVTILRRVYEMELASKQWELDALRSQINPHFLYNTLEYIRGMALYHGVSEISETALALARLMRYSIKGAEMSTLGEEVDCLRRYVTIIVHRFSQRIEADIECGEDLHHCVVPKMLLQPLVENAVLHGLEPKLGKGCVKVRFRREGDMLHCLIQDDGIGIQAEELSSLQEALAQETRERNTGLGLHSIQRRISLIYENEPKARLDIESTSGLGTCVRLCIPMMENRTYMEEGEERHA